MRPARRAVPDAYVVRLAEGVTPDEVLDDLPGSPRAQRVFRSAVNGFAIDLPPGLARRLAEDERVIAVEQDLLYESQSTQTRPPWGLDRLDQRRRPLDDSYTYRNRGRGVKVYVVDSGVSARHRDFGDRVRGGFDALGQGTTRDCLGHGTHVASTAVGRRWGVAKAARVVPVRVGCGNLRLRDILAGLDFVARNHRARRPAVANLSLGGPGSSTFDAAVRRVINDGVTVVAAAGNEGFNACYSSPARVGGVITVGAINRYDAIPLWSNFGSCIDVFAPGVEVRAARAGTRSRSVVMSGTSMATPHVSGVAARYLDARPRATPAMVARAILDRAVPGVRDRYPGDPDRLLQLAGKTPTKLSQSASSSNVVYGRSLTVAGTLRNRITDKPLAGRSVVLYHRPVGTTAWRRVGSRTTDSRGRVRLTTIPNRAGDWQLRAVSSPYSRASRAGATRVALARASTAVTTDGFTWVEEGSTTELSGSLYSAVTGAPISNATLVLDVRPAGTAEWTPSATATTGTGGTASVVVAPQATGDAYRFRYAGSAWYLPATSHAITITVMAPFAP